MKTKNLRTLVIVWTLLFWVTTAASNFMHYETVDGIGTITICDWNDSSKCITMKDRNEWATEAWVGCIQYQNYCTPIWEWFWMSSLQECVDNYGSVCNLWWEYFWIFSSQSDCEDNWEALYNTCLSEHSWVIWNHYQRWNNHWFAPCTDSNRCKTFPNNESTDSNKMDCGPYSPENPLDSSTFVVNWSDYCQTQNDNMRWWENDSQENNRWYDETNNVALNVGDRQWPCPEWYHVPSIWEWNQLLEYWAQENKVNLGDPLRWWNRYTLDWLKFQSDFKIPFAGARYYDAKVFDVGRYANLLSSSPNAGNEFAHHFSLYSHGALAYDGDGRAFGFSIRCFKDYALTFPIVETTDDEDFTVTVWNQTYTWLDDIMEVTTNNIEEETMENKPVVWEVSVSFGENVTAKFNKLVQVNIPVSDYEDVIVKVKHVWSSGYNFDWLTLNRNATCNDNWRPTSSQYNWEIISVVDWYASIYTCEASSFVALWLRPWEALGEVTLTLTAWENTCTLNDYNLWTHNVSSDDQNVSTSWQDIVCEFLKNPWATIQLSMWDLVDWTKEIWRQYFTWIVTSLWNSLWSIANLTWWSYNFLSSHIIYTKEVNTIWTWTWSLAIEWIIPAWTPSWEYTWELNIIICEGC